MITFRARMYNVTSGEYLNSAPTDYSFAEYFGYTGTQEASNPLQPLIDWWLNGGINYYIEPVVVDDPIEVDVMFGRSGETLTNIPYTRFTFIRSTNVGTWFEYYAKKYYDEMSTWPILRLLKTNSVDSYYLEWNHSYPNGFNIKSDGGVSRWEWCFQWDDAFNSHYTDERKYNLLFSTVFVNSSTLSDLANPRFLKYSGAFCFNETTGSLDTLVGSQVYTVAVNPDYIIGGHEVFCTANMKRTQNAGNRYRYFSTNGSGDEIAIACVYISSKWLAPIVMAPVIENSAIEPYTLSNIYYGDRSGSSAINFVDYGGIRWGWASSSGSIDISDFKYTTYESTVPTYNEPTTELTPNITEILTWINPIIASNSAFLYYYLLGTFVPIIPSSDVDPEDVPPEDEPPTPIPPDDTDPYYDPVADPDSPQYDPTQNPEDPDYDPTIPHDPWKPPTSASPIVPAPEQPPQDNIDIPEIPPAFVTNNAMFTLYNPSGGDLNNLAAFLWSPAWSVDTFKKIFANPLDCILGLMVMPLLPASVNTKEMSVGNIATGVTMHYFTNQFYDFDCGTFTIEEFYMSYLDYAPYTKVSIYLPYIGAQVLDTDEVMGKTVGVKYRFDLATGDCVAFVTVNGSVFYTYSGNCASRLPLSGNNWNGIMPAVTTAMVGGVAAGVPALGAAAALAVSSMKQNIAHSGSMAGSPGLMGIQKPYLIITRPRQAMPLAQNSFTGYPSFITENMGGLSGYTEIESCHLEHIPCTAQELEEIENLLKEGVLF